MPRCFVNLCSAAIDFFCTTCLVRFGKVKIVLKFGLYFTREVPLLVGWSKFNQLSDSNLGRLSLKNERFFCAMFPCRNFPWKWTTFLTNYFVVTSTLGHIIVKWQNKVELHKLLNLIFHRCFPSVLSDLDEPVLILRRRRWLKNEKGRNVGNRHVFILADSIRVDLKSKGALKKHLSLPSSLRLPLGVKHQSK